MWWTNGEEAYYAGNGYFVRFPIRGIMEKPEGPFPQQQEKGYPCSHPGCMSHISHPCEGCGRQWGRTIKEKQIVEKESDK